jgi:hypothetical protein
MLLVNYRYIIAHYRKQLWGVFHYVVLSVLQEVTVGYIACGRLHMSEYVFPDLQCVSIYSLYREQPP